jgi:hypothetical protein
LLRQSKKFAPEIAKVGQITNQTETNSKREFKRKVSRSRRSDSDNGSMIASSTSIQQNNAKYTTAGGHHSQLTVNIQPLGTSMV